MSLGNTILKDIIPDEIKTILMKRMIDSYQYLCWNEKSKYISLEAISNLKCDV